MPFGSAANGEYGTYFIGYARSPQTIEQMLTNMFVGRPPGNYDRLLDVSRAITGSLFFVPSMPLLESLADGARPAAPRTALASGRPDPTQPAQTQPVRTRPPPRGPAPTRAETGSPGRPHHPTPPDNPASAAYEE